MRRLAIITLSLLLALPSCCAAAPAAPSSDIDPASAGAEAGASEPGIDPAELEALRVADQQLLERLRARLAVIPGLEKARVDVAAGVVTLRGEAADDGRRQLAVVLAEQADGVVHVDNQLQIDTDVRVRTAPVFEHARESILQFIGALPLFALALLIVAGSAWLGRWLSRRPGLLGRARRNPFLARLAGQGIQLLVVLVGLVVALDLLNATALVGALLGTAGVIGIAVGFAFRDVVENYLAGVLLSLRQPFAPHDHVSIDGHEGKVAALTSRATILITLDGNHLRLPNALVFKGVTLNYSRNPSRRFSFDVGIASDASVSAAQAVALACLRDMEAVLDDPGPSVLLAELGDSSCVLRMGGWVDQRATSFGRARSEAIRLVRRAFIEAGIEMPDPGYRVELLRAPELPSAPVGGGHRPAPPPRADESAEVADLSPEVHIDRQVDDEQAGLAGDNLLDPNARRE